MPSTLKNSGVTNWPRICCGSPEPAIVTSQPLKAARLAKDLLVRWVSKKSPGEIGSVPAEFSGVPQSVMTRSIRGNGNGCRTSQLTVENAELLTPTPSASERITTKVNPGL